MQYYKISPAAGTKETGQAFPQLDDINPEYDFYAPDSVYKINAFKIPDFIPNLDYFILNPKAKLTDVLSQAAISAYGLMVSKKFKNLLSEFNIQEHRFYKAKIKTKNDFITYYWMHLGETNILNEIDYSKSSFYIKKGLKRIPLTISSYKDYQEKRKNADTLSVIKTEQLYLQKQEHDLFIVPFLDGNIYISNELYNKIISQISGISIDTSILKI